MKVSELIEQLKTLEQDREIYLDDEFGLQRMDIFYTKRGDYAFVGDQLPNYEDDVSTEDRIFNNTEED